MLKFAVTSAPPRVLKQTAVPTLAFVDSADVGHHVALVIASLIRENNSAGMPTVLGLPTGSTPTGVYRALIQLHQEEGLDFSRVITFNLDEYWPMPADSIHSYQRFMRETFFDHVNIPEENIHIPRGDLPVEEVEEFCEEYERDIERVGGIDLMLLGLGRNGHIGFNEPGSDKSTRTRLVTLDPVTRQDAGGDFFGEENVPMQAITMGLGTILSARKIIVMVLGEHKAVTVQKAVEEEITSAVPASFLQTHRNAIIAVDQAAAARLTAIATPWLISDIRWSHRTEKQAVIWLAQRTGKAILKLEAADFHFNHLHQLLRERGPLEAIRQRVFQDLLAGICVQPGGDSPRRVLVFSPHPDDDVISMGGTLITLAQQKHDVHVAYMTNGNIAVFDHDALRHINYVEELQTTFGLDSPSAFEFYESLRRDIAGKGPGDPDSQNVLNVKSLIRKTEAVAAGMAAGVPAEKCHFLDLPFYRTGEITKKPIGEEDVAIVAALLRELSPEQVYVAGDLTDPHGTHRLCAEAIFRALRLVATDGLTPEVWLYRGAWQEYEPDEIERAVPLSPELTNQKRQAIFKHESQKDRARYPGHDEREFWERAEDRTKRTARIYNELGLPEFFALEGFVRYRGQL
jgi:glucosamine-6-phosphate deaminase